MRRRDLLGCAAAMAGLAPLRSRAQGQRFPTIGVLLDGSERVIPQVLREELRRLGHIGGQTVRLEFRSAEGDARRLPGLATELVSRKVDVIVAPLTGAAIAAKQATGVIPIVMVYVGDPVGMGIVASLARPGGNITGLSSLAQDAAAKQIELLKDAVPHATRFAALCDRGPYGAALSAQLAAAGDARGVAVDPVAVTTAAESEAAFAAMAERRIDGVVIQGVFSSGRVAELALRHRLPSVSQHPVFARQGGLIGYFSDPAENARRAAVLIDKILKGAKPADLPVEQPTRFELVINLKTAKALGITVPQSLLARADEVLE